MAELVTYVIEERGGSRDDTAPERLLFLLHGYGATEHDFTALGPLVDPDVHYLVAGARAPVALPDGGHAWFEFGPRGPDADGLSAAVDAVRTAVDTLCDERGFRRDQVVLGGFSQGAAVALAAGLTPGGGPPPAGVLVHSGFVAEAEGREWDWSAAVGVPVLVVHGTRDVIVDVELARGTADLLAHHGAAVTFHELDMGHQQTVESLRVARDWLAGLPQVD